MNGEPAWDLPPAPSAGSIKAAHLTDPHLSNLAGVSAFGLRDQRLLGWLSWRRKRRRVHQRATLEAIVAAARRSAPDHWCITGDLTHIGHEQELSEAASWLRSLAPPKGLSVIPGNHDLYIPTRSQAALEAQWGRYLAEGGDRWPRLQLRGAVAFISVNSGHAAPPAFATGALGAGQRSRLRACLAATGAAGYARVLLIHHAPGPGMDKWRKRLVDAPEVAAILQQAGAELVLHGHCHESLSRSLTGPRGPIPVLSAPSASATGEQGCRTAGLNEIAVGVTADGVTIEATGVRLGGPPHWTLQTTLPRPGA